MLHLQRLCLTFNYLFHIIHIFYDAFQVSFFIIKLVVAVAKTMFVIDFRFQGKIVVEFLPIAVFSALFVVTIQHFPSIEKSFFIGNDFNKPASGVINRRDAVFITVLNGNHLQQMVFSIVTAALFTSDIVDKKVFLNLI